MKMGKLILSAVLAGTANTKRTDYFLKAAGELKIPVFFEDIIHCVPESLEKAVVKLDPVVYGEMKIGQMDALLEQYTRILSCFASNRMIKFLNHPDSVMQVLHKIRLFVWDRYHRSCFLMWMVPW